MHKKIMFDSSLIGAEMTDEEKKQEALKLLEETGWPEKKHALIRVNPELFARFKYLSRINIEEMFNQDKKFWQPILTNLYTMLQNDPMVDHENLLRRLMRSYFNSEGDSLVKKTPGQMPGLQLPPPAQGGAPGTSGPGAGQPVKSQNALGAMAQSRALSTTIAPEANQ